MIRTDVDGARQFIQQGEYDKTYEMAKEAFRQVEEASGAGNNWLGWRRILKSPNDAELDSIERHAAEIREHADIFIICGIGGSYTGAKAIIESLTPHFESDGPEIIYAGHHMGGRYLDDLMQYIQIPRKDGQPKKVYLNVISKSGSTLETALAFRTIRTWMHEVYGDDAKDQIIATTGKKGGSPQQNY